MKICSPHVGISPESNSGGEVYEREILKHMALLGASIEIILPRGKPYEAGIPNWNVTQLPVGRGYTWYGAPILFLPAINRVWKERGFDILRIHSLRNTGTAALLFRILSHAKVPLISHHHHIDEANPIDRWILKASDRIVTVSKFAKAQLIDIYGLDPKKIFVIYNGIDSKFMPEEKDFQLLKRFGLVDKKVLFFLGELKPRKNPLFLIDMFKEIIKVKGKGVCLVIAGDGELMEKMKRKSKELGIEKQIIFTGYVREEDKVKYYNLADVFIFPSRMEGFGLVVGEAMSCAKPVVAFSVASLPELVKDGVTGFLAHPEDKEDFVRKILKLIDDSRLAIDMGLKGKEEVDNRFRWDISAKRTLEVYEECLI